ncbi:MAG: Ferredoxin-3 [Anaerolineales bacterium]|nr:Ferredoxin-3 [Anaerolineales bacterium]
MAVQSPSLWESLLEHVEIARTLRGLEIHYDESECTGAWECYAVCPVGCWTPDLERRKVIFHDPERCVACGACVLQCPEDAIRLE